MPDLNRRNFLKTMALSAPAFALNPAEFLDFDSSKKMFFKISLAEWSFHKAIFAGKMTNLDFPVKAKKEYGIDIVEYVNQFFKDRAKDKTYLKELKMRCKDNGVKNHLIMIDGEGNLGDADSKKRIQAIENHYKWVEAAKFLGCKTIRVNAAGDGSPDDVSKRCIESLRKLSEFGSMHKINIIVENHGGYSSNGKWLADVMKNVGMKNCGTLPDFGNFCLKWAEGKDYKECAEKYDPYEGVQEMMPYAKGVSAKSHDFDETGNETTLDYLRLLKIVKEADFKGIVGIEYEGSTLSEEDGVRKTLDLLKKVGTILT
jgi:sugar phosphate isomerase/epimerase